jgi:hypothetical protein
VRYTPIGYGNAAGAGRLASKNRRSEASQIAYQVVTGNPQLQPFTAIALLHILRNCDHLNEIQHRSPHKL